MEDSQTTDKLTEFLSSGIYRFEDSNAVFIDPVRMLNRSYTRFRVSPSAYYCRRFESTCPPEPGVALNSRKRKRKMTKKRQALNEREQVADQRHQKVRPLLVKAHESLIRASEVLEVMSNLRGLETSFPGVEQSFVELGQLWQAPLYAISLNFDKDYRAGENGGSVASQDCRQCVVPVFNNLVVNESSNDVEAEVLTSLYILPPKSSFYMSIMGQIRNLIPAESDCGFSVIVVDPPWENGSARQKSRYKTLPNRYFLSVPIKQLCHKDGALVALWVTNREKLRDFVEKELFPAWGVTHVATFFWLKVKADGSLICDLDLFHHRPYECLLVGICHGKVMNSEQLLGSDHIPGNQIILSVPGDYSRKPPIGGLLQEFAPRLKGRRCVELFARELTSGWVSWETMIRLFKVKEKQQEVLDNAKEKAPVKKQSAGELRVQKDITELNLPNTINIAFPNGQDDLMNFEVTIEPDEGYYKGGRFLFTFEVTPVYPHEQPKVKCETKVYHPNIDLEGNICLNILREDWKPVLNISTVIYGLYYLFTQPNYEDPLNHEAAEVLRDNPEVFESNVKRAIAGDNWIGATYFPRPDYY